MSKESAPVNGHVKHLATWARDTNSARKEIGLVRHQTRTESNKYNTASLRKASARHNRVAKAALELACPECPFADICSAEGDVEKIERTFSTAKERNKLVKRAEKGEACSASWLKRPYDGFTESPDEEDLEEVA